MDAEPSAIDKLVAAVNAVMKDVDYVVKGGHNEKQDYSYVSDADLALALQPALVKHGLVILPTGSVTQNQEHGKAQSGATMWRTDLIQTYCLAHKSGQRVFLQVAGAGTDVQDKAPYKAMTGALKYVLRQTFLIPTGDDAEKPLPAAEQLKASEDLFNKLSARLKAVTTKAEYEAAREAVVADWGKLSADHQKELVALSNAAEEGLK